MEGLDVVGKRISEAEFTYSLQGNQSHHASFPSFAVSDTERRKKASTCHQNDYKNF